MIRDLPQVWRGFSRTRQIAIGGVAGAVVLAIVAGILYLQRPQTVPLYTSLNEQDASAIVGKLKELKVPYTVADGGSTIRVPAATSADLRLQLAGLGLPSGSGVGMVGMEVFDKTNLGITDFAQKLNYQRGLEGELTRTIRRLSAVEDARVHLVLPQDRLFTSQQKDTTASVMIRERTGRKLADDQVSSIKFLVSKAVEGLKPENVAVVDFNGNTLGKLDTTEEATNKVATNRIDVQRQREQELERKIQGLLDQVLGPNHSVVRASVALDWDEVKRNVETYSPGTTQPQTRSQRDTRENFAGAGVNINPPVGVPGTQANIPTYQTSGANSNSNYQRSDVTTNYEVSSDKQAIVKAPGEIKSLGVAVMVDQAVVAAQVDQITQVVAAAAGIQPQRGDQVSVVSLPFDNSLAVRLKDQQRQEKIMEYVQAGSRLVGVLVALVGIFILFRYLTGTVRPKEPPLLAAADPDLLPGGTAALLPPGMVEAQIAQAAESLAPQRVPVPDRATIEAELRRKIESEYAAKDQAHRGAEGNAATEADSARRMRVRDSVIQLAMQKPDVLADVLSTWLEHSRDQAANGAAA